jgi:small-conductance mechanosensitive channel
MDSVRQFFNSTLGHVQTGHLANAFAAIVIIFVGLFLARRASSALTRLPNLDIQQKLILKKFSYYVLATLVIAAALNQLGFDLKVILGAAGVLTVAVGFAAQTSASNLISGLFLMIDRPFSIGDGIEVDAVKGEVLSIDLLSTKIRTFDNRLIRVPNETMVKSNITNLSFFPLRRVDMKFGVGYNDSIIKVRDILIDLSSRNPLVLDEPEPLFIFEGFGASSQDVFFAVWTLRENYLDVQNSMLSEIKVRFDREGIEIPFPTRTLIYTEKTSS